MLPRYSKHKSVQKSARNYKIYGKAITTDTASWWIKDGLSSAGVHTAVFKSHCGRSASSSKAQGIGIPVQDILKY